MQTRSRIALAMATEISTSSQVGSLPVLRHVYTPLSFEISPRMGLVHAKVASSGRIEQVYGTEVIHLSRAWKFDLIALGYGGTKVIKNMHAAIETPIHKSIHDVLHSRSLPQSCCAKFQDAHLQDDRRTRLEGDGGASNGDEAPW